MLKDNMNVVEEAKGSEEEISDVKDKIRGLLDGNSVGELRAQKMDTDDFLYVLSIFSEAGFQFN
jgi:hypothetical protein